MKLEKADTSSISWHATHAESQNYGSALLCFKTSVPFPIYKFKGVVVFNHGEAQSYTILEISELLGWSDGSCRRNTAREGHPVLEVCRGGGSGGAGETHRISRGHRQAAACSTFSASSSRKSCAASAALFFFGSGGGASSGGAGCAVPLAGAMSSSVNVMSSSSPMPAIAHQLVELSLAV